MTKQVDLFEGKIEFDVNIVYFFKPDFKIKVTAIDAYHAKCQALGKSGYSNLEMYDNHKTTINKILR